MSHLKERKEKSCLNCQTRPLYGRYCHVCGQENLEPKETVWHLVRHFFEDVTHFDGKFFATVKYLLKKPGFLSTEYSAGRRASYLNPIRMYVFTSAIFFIALFLLNSPQKELSNADQVEHKAGFNSGKNRPVPLISGDTSDKLEGQGVHVWLQSSTEMHPEKFRTVGSYDTFQSRQPDSLKNGWLKRQIMRRFIATNGKYEQDSRSFNEQLTENFLHSFPKVLFLSLPFFAMILRLLYLRRKKYFYVDHGIFTIHLYCSTFILMLTCILLAELANWVSWHWLQTGCTWLLFAIILYMFIYLYLAMRSFYGQGRWKTFFKYVLLGITGLIINGMLLVLSFLISAISI